MSSSNISVVTDPSSSLFLLSRLVVDLTGDDSDQEDGRSRELQAMFGSDSDSDSCDPGSPRLRVNAVLGCGCDHCEAAPQPAEPLMFLDEEPEFSSHLEGVRSVWPVAVRDSVGGSTILHSDDGAGFHASSGDGDGSNCTVESGESNNFSSVGSSDVGSSDGRGGYNGRLEGGDYCWAAGYAVPSSVGGGGINSGDASCGSAGQDWEWSRVEAATHDVGNDWMEVSADSHSSMGGYSSSAYSSCSACECRGVVCVCGSEDSSSGSESGNEDYGSSSESGSDCSSMSSEEEEICGAPTRDGIQCTNTVYCAWARHQRWRVTSGYGCAVPDLMACPRHPLILLSSCAACAELRSAARTRLSGARSRPVVLPYPEWVGLHAMLQ